MAASLFFLCTLGITLLSASTIYVKTSTTNGNGNSWNSAFNNVQDALKEARQGDEIWIAKGTYYPTTTQSSTDRSATFLLKSVISVYGGFNGTESTINQRPKPLAETILSGNIGDSSINTDNSYHVINLDVQHAVLDGLIIQGGYAMNDNVSNYSTCPTCFGGALYDGCFQPMPMEQINLNINQCTFRDNTAISGGAIFGMCTTNYAITNSIFENNKALNGAYKGGYGGAIMVAYIGDMNVSNTLFNNNMASGSGGAAHCDYGMVCTYTDCTFTNNYVKEGNGGALSLIDRDSQRGFSSLYVSKSTFENNYAANTVAGSAGYGGAIYFFDNDASGYITSSKFTNNSANLGGAIGSYGDSHCKECCDTRSGNTFTNNVGKNGDNDCFVGDFPSFTSVPVTVDDPLKYLGLMYDQATKFVDPNTPPQSANIVYVNMNSKAVRPTGTSWNEAFSSLQDGIDAAEQILMKDKTTTVEVWAAGSSNYEKEKYVPERVPMWYNTSAPYYDATKSKMIEVPPNVRLFGGFAGTETKREERNFFKNPTLIDAYITDTKAGQTYQVVYVHENVYIDGFMIANGYAYPGPPPPSPKPTNKLESGSLRQTNPNQVLTDPTPVRGAGIFANVTALNVANVLFYGHFSTKGSGFYVLGNPTFKHNVTGYNLGFIGNYATDRGGAFAVDLYGEFNCVGCSFWTNVCSHKGGAVYSDFWAHSIFDQCTFYNNTGYDSGGAIGMDAGYSQITNCNFTDNYAFSEGAAAYTGSYNPFGGGDDDLPNHFYFKNNYYQDNVCASGNINHYLWTYDYWVSL